MKILEESIEKKLLAISLANGQKHKKQKQKSTHRTVSHLKASTQQKKQLKWKYEEESKVQFQALKMGKTPFWWFDP